MILLGFQTGPNLANPESRNVALSRFVKFAMDNAVYVGLSRQMVLRREMDIIANNIANIDTNGFKVESLMQKTDPGYPAVTLGGGNCRAGFGPVNTR